MNITLHNVIVTTNDTNANTDINTDTHTHTHTDTYTHTHTAVARHAGQARAVAEGQARALAEGVRQEGAGMTPVINVPLRYTIIQRIGIGSLTVCLGIGCGRLYAKGSAKKDAEGVRGYVMLCDRMLCDRMLCYGYMMLQYSRLC